MKLTPQSCQQFVQKILFDCVNVSYNLPQPTRRAVQQVGVWSWQVQGFRHGKPRYYQGKHFVDLDIISKKIRFES